MPLSLKAGCDGQRRSIVSEQVYHFGFGVDARYVKYAGVLMTNLVHQHLGQPLCFHLACDGIGEEDR